MLFLLNIYGSYGGYHRMGYGFDMTYLLLVIPAFILSLIAQAAVKNAYRKMAKVSSSKGYTGAQAAAAVLRYYNIGDVRIEKIGGTLSDHFDPRTNVIAHIREEERFLLHCIGPGSRFRILLEE